ncbi:hypothetical protein [Brucella rhizosphaerae]|uniref:hypothetical protein n=1 Tax=Brucella rhizosphaerae TaxID=571254 RepID=UPI00360CEFC1
MTRLVAPDYIFLNGRLQTGLVAEISAAGIDRLRPRKSDEMPDLTPHVLMPACIDLQVNGAGGVMLNSDTSARYRSYHFNAAQTWHWLGSANIDYLRARAHRSGGSCRCRV